ncbi:MAG: 50S ribosomal protein L2 [Deltaproteobacteria bacterium]|nr:MAG: 50S ribosomal protein L2 [Deltaproteobacteria bacterium]
MAVKTFNPTTPNQRYRTVVDFSLLSKVKPEKSLLSSINKKGGRNNTGRVTMRFIGGGHKRRYRLIDFKRDKEGVPGRIESVEYDPNRTAFIAKVLYKDGERRYILAPHGLKVGDSVLTSEHAEIRPGNHLQIKNIPVGTEIHNIELSPGMGGKVVRSAGGMAQLVAKEGTYAQIRMPSGEVRLIHLNCSATIGQVSNLDNENVVLGKAGRSRWLGRLPRQRGVSMNPVDHPHGGGEGKSKGGNHPTSPWGTPAKGYKTRKNKRTQKFIVKDRRQKL